MGLRFLLFATCVAIGSLGQAYAQTPNWVTSWAGSVQGPYPLGNPSAQPDMRFAFPSAEKGALDQTIRLIVRPSFWGKQARFRLSNALGTRPVTFGGVFAGLQRSGSVVEPKSNQPVTFGGAATVSVAPGQAVWSDPVDLPFVPAQDDPALLGRRLAVSLHVTGESGPMTWHAKAMTTSYVTPPGTGSKGASDGILDFHSVPPRGSS